MKLIDAEYTFDNNKVLFYFTADGRIDFRELVKDLASVFKTRIELARSVSEMRPRSWEVLESVAERYAVMRIYQNLYPYLLKWQRSRICH